MEFGFWLFMITLVLVIGFTKIKESDNVVNALRKGQTVVIDGTIYNCSIEAKEEK